MTIAQKVKFPSDVYDRNAHRRFLRQQKREQESLERERLEREKSEKAARDYWNKRNASFNLLMTMHDLDRKVLVKQAIDKLNPRLKFIAIRRFYQNQSINSIAEELNLSRNRVWQLELRLLGEIKRGIMSGKM